MKLTEIEIEEKDKILKGLKLTYKKLIEFKKQKNSPLVVMRGNKIVHIEAKDL